MQKIFSAHTFKETLDLIKELEKYYDNREVVGLILRRVYEPEWYWDGAIPETSGWQNSTTYIRPARYECDWEKKAGETIRKLRIISGCHQFGFSGCDGETGKLLYAGEKKDPVNIGHVFAGLSLYYFPKNEVPLIYTNNIRTYTGDYGGALSASYKFGSVADAASTNEQNYKQKLDYWLWEGNIKKFDIPADMDSYSIVQMMKDKNLKISDALAEYYGTENSYYNNRYTFVRQKSINPDYPDFVDMKLEIDMFARYLSSNFGNILVSPYKNEHQTHVTKRVYDVNSCLENSSNPVNTWKNMFVKGVESIGKENDLSTGKYNYMKDICNK